MNDLVFAAQQRAAFLFQRSSDRLIARQCCWLVIMIDENSLNAQLSYQCWYRCLRARMAHDQSATLSAQGSIKLDKAGMQEGDAPIQLAVLQQGIKNILVKNESTVHAAAALQRVMQRCMIKIAQVAAEPDQ